MTPTQAKLSEINAKILAEHSRLHDAIGKGIVVIWAAVVVFIAAGVMEPHYRTVDLISQEDVTWQK